MPRQDSRDLHQDALLTDVAISYFQDQKNYVASRVFPSVPVKKESDYYRKYSLSDLLRLRARPRANGDEAAIMSLGSSDERYQVECYAGKDFVTTRDLANDDGPIGIMEVRTKGVVQGHLTNLEITWGEKYFTTGVWGTDLTGASTSTPNATQIRHFDHSGCDPVQQIHRVKRMMQSVTGFMPNLLVFAPNVIDNLLSNSSILARIDGSSSSSAPAIVNMEILARLFGVDEVLEASAVYNSAAEGATDSISNLFSNDGLLVHRAKTPSKDVPSAGYTFVHTAPDGASKPGEVQVYTYFRDELKREDIEAEMYVDQKVTASNLGIFLDGLLANP